MRLVILPSHPTDADSHYRLIGPARELGRHGWRVEIAPHVSEEQPGGRSRAHYGLFEQAGEGRVRLVKPITEWLAERDFDVLLMQQREEPFWAEVIGQLRAQGKRVLVDSDDVWMGLPSWNPASQKPRQAVDAMLAQLAAADGLSVATPSLAALYEPWQPNVRVVRNRLDWSMWADVAPVSEARGWERLRVGWMGDTSWRAGDLKVLRGVIGPWLEQHPDVDFVAAGDPRTHDLLGVPTAQRVSVASTRFSQLDLADITATFDVGLVPLDLSSPESRALNEGKSHLKGMEYNACGVPFVASPTESYRWYSGEGGVGILAGSPGGWRTALDTLVADREELAELAELAREEASGHTIQEGWDEWADWLSDGRGVDSDVAVAEAVA